MTAPAIHGSCLCGAVQFDLLPPLRPVILCHCQQCRKTSGHVWAATSVSQDRFQLTRDEGLAWFASSEKATRGFCTGCGSSLFWQPTGGQTISVAAGALDGSTGLAIMEQWFTQDRGDYYTLDPNIPCREG